MAEKQHEEDDQRRGKVMTLIEKATNSTDPELDPRLLKAIKTTVRYSDVELKFAAQTLIQLMKRPHSQVRYLAFMIIDELFMRSKLFRSLIVENFDQLLSLSIGFRRNQVLPAPQKVAAVLRAKAIECLEKWNISFGVHYRQIRIGYDYLKNTLRFQFPNLQANAARAREVRREREVRTQEILRSKFEALREGLGSIREEIRSTVEEIGECLEIAKANDESAMGVPLDDVEEEEFEVRNAELQRMRMDSLKEAEKVHENNENKVVFDTLRELYKLLVTKHLVSVQQWISVIIRVEVDDARCRDSVLKDFIDIRNQISAVKKKCEESGCSLPNLKDSEEDDIWEEGGVDFAGSSRDVSSEMTAKMVVSAVDAAECSDKGAKKRDVVKGKGAAHKAKVGAVESNSLKGKLLAEAPVVNWGSHLDSWGEKRDAMAHSRGLEVDGHWGRIDYDATIPAEKIAELNVHATLYKEEQAEIQPCRAPLRKGGLCQRQDLRVCPFHGPVIPRDDEGRPVHSRVDEGAAAQTRDHGSVSMSRSPSADEMNIDEESISMKQLAEQAVKNVRERDEGEAKKKEIDKRAVKKAKLAKVRDHNQTVLREAAMASTSSSAAFGEFEGGLSGERSTAKNKKPTLASMLRNKVTSKDRLSQKLLSSRARGATVKQLIQGEDAKYRESFPNQW